LRAQTSGIAISRFARIFIMGKAFPDNTRGCIFVGTVPELGYLPNHAQSGRVRSHRADAGTRLQEVP